MATPLNMNLYGTDHQLYFYHTADKGLSLGLIEEEDGMLLPYMDVTLEGVGTCKPDEAFVKDYSENEGIGKWLVQNKIAEPTGEIYRTGYVTIEKYKFDLAALQEHMI